MKILVIGSGGREHALVWKLVQSPRVSQVYCAPGNGGIERIATCVPISPKDHQELIKFAKEKGIGLTVVGPEAPLLDGIVNAFEEAGLSIYGPSKEAALIEGSKAFAKELMIRYGIPTAEYKEFTDYDSAWKYVQQKGTPIVIKADGLAAGKGVIVAHTIDVAQQALDEMINQAAFGEAGAKVVIEEFLEGEELTLLSFVDGETVLPMEPAQDHKPVFNGDQGPNTGGMGAYSPLPHLPETIVEEIYMKIVQPVATAMIKEERPFRGILYTGLILTKEGPKVIEFNARFGDPETQVILPRLETDLVEIMEKTFEGKLDEVKLEWSSQASLTVILAAPGYPGNYPKDLLITGLDQINSHSERQIIFHSGTRVDEGGHYRTNGGRVLAITGMGDTLQEAKEQAYDGVKKLHFEGVHYRTDIGDRALRPKV